MGRSNYNAMRRALADQRMYERIGDEEQKRIDRLAGAKRKLGRELIMDEKRLLNLERTTGF